MPQLRVLLGFSNAADHEIAERADEVAGGLYVSELWNPLPVGVTFPVTLVALEAARDAFTEAMAKADMGGPADTAEKNNKRADVIALLRKLAGFVQEHHGNDLAKLLASGFEAVSNNRAQTQLEKPNIRDLRHGTSGQLIARVEPVRNVRNFEAQYALIGPGGTPGPWQTAGLFGDSRGIPIDGLTPGAEYLIRIRAVGGLTGYSDWSASRSARTM